MYFCAGFQCHLDRFYNLLLNTFVMHIYLCCIFITMVFMLCVIVSRHSYFLLFLFYYFIIAFFYTYEKNIFIYLIAIIPFVFINYLQIYVFLNSGKVVSKLPFILILKIRSMSPGTLECLSIKTRSNHLSLH